MSSSRGEKSKKINRAALESRITKASLDLTKESPSNGQCPTMVSSRHHTIQSRDVSVPRASANEHPGAGISNSSYHQQQAETVQAAEAQPLTKQFTFFQNTGDHVSLQHATISVKPVICPV